MTVLDKYFELSDRAVFDESAFGELVDLFAEQAEVEPSGGSKVQGKVAIAELYKVFFQMYKGLQRVWTVSSTETGLEAAWAIAGQHHDGKIFSMQGSHEAQLDSHGKICALKVRVDDNESVHVE